MIGTLRLPVARAERAVQFFAGYVEHLAIDAATLPGLRDPTDAAIVAAARATGADLLVSGDQDIRAVALSVDIAVVSPRGAWERLRAGSDPHGEVNEA